MAKVFSIRIEMRQIGLRQRPHVWEGLAPVEGELCCSTWLTDYRPVSTAAARYQQLSLNPIKLAGQCGKLKCCLNYELDSIVQHLNLFRNQGQTKLKGVVIMQKMDILRANCTLISESTKWHLLSLALLMISLI